jgi:hypothetical protein
VHMSLVALVSLAALALTGLIGIGIGIGARRGRRRFCQAGESFRCRFRAWGGTGVAWPRLSHRWSRPMWAVWIDGDLVVRRGPVLNRTIRLRATVTPTGVYGIPAGKAKWCGRHPIGLRLQTGDGTQVEVAANEGARMPLVGPYLAAAINELPQAPAPRRRI